MGEEMQVQRIKGKKERTETNPGDRSSLELRRDFPTGREINLQNNMSSEVVGASSLEVFKKRLENFLTGNLSSLGRGLNPKMNGCGNWHPHGDGLQLQLTRLYDGVPRSALSIVPLSNRNDVGLSDSRKSEDYLVGTSDQQLACRGAIVNNTKAPGLRDQGFVLRAAFPDFPVPSSRLLGLTTRERQRQMGLKIHQLSAPIQNSIRKLPHPPLFKKNLGNERMGRREGKGREGKEKDEEGRGRGKGRKEKEREGKGKERKGWREGGRQGKK
ncbi:hypothetical protein L345_08867, partial [Ophiophagus hannah]